MKKLILITCLFILSCSQRSDDDTAIGLKRFYSYYIVQMDRVPIKREEVSKDTLQKYCTVSFLNSLQNEELDYDPIIQGQDYDKVWIKTLTVTKLTDGATKEYKVCIQYDINKYHCILVYLKNEKGEWKIDNTKEDNNKS